MQDSQTKNRIESNFQATQEYVALNFEKCKVINEDFEKWQTQKDTAHQNMLLKDAKTALLTLRNWSQNIA